ncbi:hypothetical protein SAMD00019534_068550 [Acytostelium subglobosum LB1]|uniref:hypothetical protein n=1 Tax=Acytostelium subglobosum LB1 TaxID=1410327 RepID=UPI000644E1F2|nr:hypothetical protein SAMD00019534_068550 [Acytostelium subglobosum LB1]GAM23680.1 hypothetical protein SAMD00019534_068550 [Acytostelium subglobosum LB1]|eukprot:XP_012753421.1 hypothetical protein SAMD00019534_068550 [Acytostelium subglobosum LB1]
MFSQGDTELPSPPSDSISCLKFSPQQNYLIAGSWDNKVRCWEITASSYSAPQGVPKAMADYEAPILCTDWMPDCTKVMIGGCDNKAKLWDLATNQLTQIAQHNAPIKDLFWIKEKNVMVTGSWDKTLKYWDIRQQNPVFSIDLPERVYSMDVVGETLAIATADRKAHVFNMNNPNQPFKSIESPLKYQTRCIALFTDQKGFALGSIEGRVAIQSFEENPDYTFTFKCHRDPVEKSSQKPEVAYAVNNISFAHRYTTFATAGSDGTFSFWDKDSKSRLKQFNKQPNSITSASFNADNTLYAYGVSYDWSRGMNPSAPKDIKICVHVVPDTEIKGKGRKK